MENKIAPHPLLCWDIVVEGIERRKQVKKDLEAIQQIMLNNQWREVRAAFHEALIWENKTIIVTDSQLNIIYATQNLHAMNGYYPKEVIGQHPTMFQGPATALEARKTIKLAINNLQPFETSLINYRKNGSLYTCHIEGFPIFNQQGIPVNFMAIEKAA
ncbi:MAG: PAS domain-containing protein [Bacteroidota bacterium]|jgi:PAS domain S-box-containing protein|nr:PAS domain-containing protein [Bacteroidota bacterium]